MKRLAIIVPGYNCEKYIRKCLNSIVCQIDKNDKIIFVDDGSKDLTAEIVKKEFPQVNYVFQANSGVSSARNRGLELARDYRFIMFVDSDDWLGENCICELQSNYNIEDFTFSDWVEYKMDFDNNNKIVAEICSIDKHFKPGLTVDDIRKHFLRSRSGGSPWGKIYNNRILQQYGVRFMEGLPYAEDYLFNLEYLKYAKTVRYIPKPLYAYNCLETGERGKFRKNRCDLTIQIEKKKIDLYDIKNPAYEPLINAEMVEQFAVVFLNFYNSQFPKNERKKEKRKAQQFLMSSGFSVKKIFKTDTNIKAKLLCCLLFL